MFTAIRSVRIIQQPSLFSSSSSFTLPNYHTVRPASGIRFRQAAAGTSNHHQDPNPEEMEQSQPQPPEDKKGDVMSNSFGEAYSTRCDDEGFGGIYGNRSPPGGDEDLRVHVNAPEYDKNQGSEVKEKEKGRHQTHTPS